MYDITTYMYMYMYMHTCMYIYIVIHMNKSRTQLPRLPTSLDLDVKQSPNVQDAFQPVPGLISYIGV